MPTIRVEDDVFEGLKSLAEPFVDSPNSVIRRLLLEKGALPGTKGKAEPPAPEPRKRTNGITPQPIYEAFLLHVLWKEFNGCGAKHHVTNSVINLMKRRGFIGDADLERVTTGETRAENTIAWGRNALKDRGLISKHSARGVWELTEAGLAEAKGTEGTLPMARPLNANRGTNDE